MPDPLVLTGIGIGTAFGVLVFLLVAVLLIRLASWLVDRYFGPRRPWTANQPTSMTTPRHVTGRGQPLSRSLR